MRIASPAPMPMQAVRAYDANASRQASRQLLAYSERDIARGIAQAIRDGRPSSILLAADIALSKPIVAPAELRGFAIDGGGMFRIVAPPEADYTNCITVSCNTVSMRGLTLRCHPDSSAGATTTTVLDVLTTNSLDVFVVMENCVLESNDDDAYFSSILASSGVTESVNCKIDNVISDRSITHAQTVALLSGDLGLRRSVVNTYGIELGSLRTNTTSQSRSFGNWFGPGIAGVSVQAIDDGVTVYPCTPTVNVTIANTASGAFTIDTTYDGEYPEGTGLRLVCTTLTAPGTCSLADVSATRLAGAWTPNSTDDSITLARVGTHWSEVARSNV